MALPSSNIDLDAALSCAPARPVASDIVQHMMEYFPDKGLIQHEWAKHGTCSGLTSAQYFGKVEQAFKAVQVPDRYKKLNHSQQISVHDVEQEFAQANNSPPKPFGSLATWSNWWLWKLVWTKTSITRSVLRTRGNARAAKLNWRHRSSIYSSQSYSTNPKTGQRHASTWRKFVRGGQNRSPVFQRFLLPRPLAVFCTPDPARRKSGCVSRTKRCSLLHRRTHDLAVQDVCLKLHKEVIDHHAPSTRRTSSGMPESCSIACTTSRV